MPQLPPRPLPNSYWATPTLLACEYPGAPTPAEAIPKLDALLDAGIRDFYDLTEPGELVPYEALLRERAAHAGLDPAAIRYRRLPIRDLDLPSAQCLQEALAGLEASAAAGRCAAVHCWGGIGRTGTVVGCHLMQAHGLSGAEALAYIAHEWQTVAKRDRAPRSPETDAQIAFVRGYQPAGQ
ncbi:dual specificity protein phosphatase family protein [Hymenobacter sp. BT559]|uniref:protein-tyrosine phosphatase family protein n=1 Tax=Hymenobacter sp. BT559 TaxID=2795729 RepID=UPI0018EA6A46|nr:dual specificity protein phosphatase family protein [Hymenobacter sp. BT559]MBJ6142854.1 dual specificity protein phosphatase family protein [Hymenobacter sp. BT559]